MKAITEYNLNFNEGIKSWDDALPLGNGLLGCLVWGYGSNLKFSLDRVDLWDTRQSSMVLREDFNFKELKKLIINKNQEEILKRFDDIYNEVTPTKIPAGRLELNYAEEPIEMYSTLNIQKAIAEVTLRFKNGESRISSFLHGRDKYGYIKVVGSKQSKIIVKNHDFTKKNNTKISNDSVDTSDISALEYKPCSRKFVKGMQIIIQETNESLAFALILGEREYEAKKEIVYYIASTNDGEDWLNDAINKVEEALGDGYDLCVKSHKKWWENYWNKSLINIPNKKLEKLWYLNTYLFGSASREGSLPMALQGVWTADEGKLPPWKGDYHNDLNTQLSYLHYLKSNRVQEGKAFIDYLWALVPSARNHAKKFFGLDGIAFPGVMDVKGRPLGGWSQYSYSITNHCWLCEMFHEYWLYTGDEEFLRDKGYVFLKESAKLLMAIFKEDDNGYYNIPLSTSPEIHDNTLEAWLKPTSNYDLAIIKYLFTALLDESKYLRYKEDEILWQSILERISPFHIKDKVLMINEVEMLEESHRHHSQCIGIYPLGLLKYENINDRDIIDNTLKYLEELGTENWVGYSFVWMAAIYARLKNGEKAERQLELFNDCITSVNGFHINGDYKNHGISNHKYKIFTLEGNMAAIASIQEMLLQTYDNTIRVFEAIPMEWRKKGASFKNLRGEGGVLISSSIEDDNINLLEVTPTRDWIFNIINPFGDEKVVVESNIEKKVLQGNILTIRGIKDIKYKIYQFKK